MYSQQTTKPQHLPDLTFPTCYNCQLGILKLLINAHTSRNMACTSCCPTVHLLLFPITQLFPFWFVFTGFANKDSSKTLSFLLLLPPGWLPTCPNSCIIKRKTTPGNWKALLIENWGGNDLAQGKALLVCHNMAHHLSAKLATVKY